MFLFYNMEIKEVTVIAQKTIELDDL